MFGSMFRFFKNLFSRKTLTAIDNALHLAAPYVAMALPIVEEIIRLTPTRSDDEILALLQHFGVLKVFDAQADRGVILRDIAVKVIRTKVKDPVKTSVLNLAVELAANSLKQQESQ